MLKAMKEEYVASLYKDMKKCEEEAFFTDLFYSDHEIGHAIRNLQNWMSPQPVKTVRVSSSLVAPS